MRISLRALTNIIAQPNEYAPDFIFLSVVICATTLGDISDQLWQGKARPELLYGVLALVLGIIIAAGLFGIYLYDSVVGPGNDLFRHRITLVAIGLFVLICIAGIAIEAFIAKLQDR